MKNIMVSILICLSSIVFGCKESTTEMKEDNTPRLILTADKMSGSSPMTVKFTGKFLGKIDTIQMLVPDFFLFPGHGKTLIRYALPDTTQPAKQFYTEERTYTGQGVVKLVMVLQSKYRDIYSDTLTITIN